MTRCDHVLQQRIAGSCTEELGGGGRLLKQTEEAIATTLHTGIPTAICQCPLQKVIEVEHHHGTMDAPDTSRLAFDYFMTGNF